MSKALLRALRYTRAYWRTASLAVIAMIASTAIGLISPQALRIIIDTGIAKSDHMVILLGAGALVLIAVLSGGATFIQGYLSAAASHGAAFDMRAAIFERLQRQSFAYFDRASTGQLVTRVTSDVDMVREFVGGGLIHVISAALLLTGAIVVLLAMDAGLALVAFVTIPATLAVLVIFVSRLGPLFRSFQARLAALNAIVQESVAAARLVRAFAREDIEIGRYERANQSLLEQGLAVRRTIANAFPLLFSVGTLGVGLVTIAGAIRVIQGTLTVGELVAFTSYLFVLFQPLLTIGFGAQMIARASASAERLFEVLDAPLDVAERPDARVLEKVSGRVEFVDVSLRYPGETQRTLSAISFAVEPGSVVAVVGGTGSGKTSLVSLIPRFYDVTEGSVRIDGHDVREVTIRSLRSHIGVVMQDTVLFSGTIRDNIAYGRPDATDAEIESAASVAQAHEFIRELPHGYATLVGERGVKLSGGQRQRIAIARTVLVDPRILILDDSMSSIDAQTEAALRSALETLVVGRTVFLVAHRLASVQNADVIVVLEEGRVVGIGTHETLLETSCVYADLTASHFGIEPSASTCELYESPSLIEGVVR